MAKEETQVESGRGGAERGQGEVWPYRGPRGMDDGQKFKIGNRGGSVLIWMDDRACDLAPLPYWWGRLMTLALLQHER